MEKEFTIKQVLILVAVVVVGIAFMETSAPKTTEWIQIQKTIPHWTLRCRFCFF